MNKKFFSTNRDELLSNLKEEKCMVVLSSGYEIVRSADQTYEFQVNKNFYYLTGIKQPNVHLILLKDNTDIIELLYIDEYSEHYEKWMGHRLTRKEASQLSNVCQSNIRYIPSFKDDLNFLMKDYPICYLDLETNNAVNFNSFGLQLHHDLKEKKVNVEIKDIYKEIVLLRMAKKPCEIALIQKAIETTRIGIEELMKNAQSGMYEYELEAYFDHCIKKLGNHGHAFTTIAASGINGCVLHYSTNDSIIKDGDLILFDLGSTEDEYRADISRTFPINGKFSSLQRKIYSIVLKANKKIAKVAHAGMTLKELQEICIEELTEGCLKAKLIKNKEEISKYYFHGVSHSIGLDTHDPFLRELPLPENAVISDEPGLYFKEYGIGIRIEDDLLIKKDKAIVLSKNIIKEIKDIEKFMN